LGGSCGAVAKMLMGNFRRLRKIFVNLKQNKQTRQTSKPNYTRERGTCP